MKKALWGLLLFLPVTLMAQSAAIEDGKGLYQDSRYQFVIPIVADADAAYKQWKLTVTDKLPEIVVQTKFKRGETALPFILYKSKSLDSKGKANLTYSFKITKPSGSKKEYADLVLGKEAPEVGFGLVEQPIGWTFDDKDPYGEYHFLVTIKDALTGFTKAFDFKIVLVEN